MARARQLSVKKDAKLEAVKRGEEREGEGERGVEGFRSVPSLKGGAQGVGGGFGKPKT